MSVSFCEQTIPKTFFFFLLSFLLPKRKSKREHSRLTFHWKNPSEANLWCQNRQLHHPSNFRFKISLICLFLPMENVWEVLSVKSYMLFVFIINIFLRRRLKYSCFFFFKLFFLLFTYLFIYFFYIIHSRFQTDISIFPSTDCSLYNRFMTTRLSCRRCRRIWRPDS